MTIKELKRLNIPFTTVIEPQEKEYYEPIVGDNMILTLPESGKGLVYVRNWIWDYATDMGFTKFWTFDDNIRHIYHVNNNMEYFVTDGTCLKIMEDFVNRYENVPIAGMNYEMFVLRKRSSPPFKLNKRVYSNMLIETKAKNPSGKPYRNEGFFNDDTDLCLRVLKDGYCTILFNIFVIDKVATMRMDGGMTPYYKGDGRYKMAEELKRKHPDVVEITHKWGRWQHKVNYKPFQSNRLIKKKDIDIPQGINNYGMVLKKKRNEA